MQNLNVPAMLRYDVSKPALPGKILSINESANTCNMSFNLRDGRTKTYRDIPMSSVVVDEGFLDAVKQAGQKVGRAISKAVNWVVAKVKGWLVLQAEDGEVIPTCNAPVNLAIQQAQGKTNTHSMLFMPSASLISQASQQGAKIGKVTYDDPSDRAAVNKFWKRVIKEYATSNKTLEESVKHVNEWYYCDSRAFKSLNESAIASLDAPKDMAIHNVNSAELMDLIYNSIEQQCANAPGKADIHPAVPMIWGAPGIGKSAIIKQTAKFMQKMNGSSFSMQVVNCPTIQPEDFTLPAEVETAVGSKAVVDIPKKWLPVYDPNVENVEEVDAFYNGNLSMSGKYDGGILFMDEYSRMNYRSSNIFLQLTEGRMYNSYVMASRWAMIAAANRKIDMDATKRQDYSWDNATATRFQSVNFVPTLQEWLEWATSPAKEGSSEPNVEPIITDFIKEIGESVWYKCIAFGGYTPQGIEASRANMDATEAEIEELVDDERLQSETTGYNSREWTILSDDYRARKKSLLVDPTRFAEGSENYKREAAIAADPEKRNAARKARWQFFYNQNKAALDPGKKYASEDAWKDTGKVLAFLDKWFELKGVPKYTGEDQLPSLNIKKYNMFLKIFDADECAHIWETGTMTVPEDMNKYSSSKNIDTNPSLKWKKSFQTQEKVLQQLFSRYPGGNDAMKADFMAAVEKTLKAWDEPLADVVPSKADIDKVSDEFFTINYNKVDKGRSMEETINFFIDNDGDSIEDQWRDIESAAKAGIDKGSADYSLIFMVSNGCNLLAGGDSFMSRVMNVIKFFSRAAVTTGSNKAIGAFTAYICGDASKKADAATGVATFDIEGFKRSVLGSIVYGGDDIKRDQKRVASFIAEFLAFAIAGVKHALNE